MCNHDAINSNEGRPIFTNQMVYDLERQIEGLVFVEFPLRCCYFKIEEHCPDCPYFYFSRYIKGRGNVGHFVSLEKDFEQDKNMLLLMGPLEARWRNDLYKFRRNYLLLGANGQ